MSRCLWRRSLIVVLSVGAIVAVRPVRLGWTCAAALTDFALAPLVGSIVGNYSSVLRVAPLAVTRLRLRSTGAPTPVPRAQLTARRVRRRPRSTPYKPVAPNAGRPVWAKRDEEGGAEAITAGLRIRSLGQTLARVAAVGSSFLLLAAAGCSGEPSPAPPGAIHDAGSATPSPAITSTLSPSAEPTYPSLKRFTDPFDRFAYKAAYSDCRLIGVERTAEGFGGDSDDPLSVARAYAVATFPEPVEHREAIFQGCLDGFKAATP